MGRFILVIWIRDLFRVLGYRIFRVYRLYGVRVVDNDRDIFIIIYCFYFVWFVDFGCFVFWCFGWVFGLCG